MKVAQLAAEVMAYGWSPEELHFQHPHLSMGEIHAALAYYWDHRDDIEHQIEADVNYAEQLRNSSAPSRLVTRLKAKGVQHLPL
jgi:hypothetical protein